MNNQISLSLEQPNGSTKEVIVQAEHSDPKGYGLEHATVFTVWIGTKIQVGYFTFSKDKGYWKYEGHLSTAEQKEIAEFIQTYREADWE